MKQTFKKDINGHYLQFNRLLYPLRYTIKLDDEGSSGEQIEVRKDGDGNWTSTGGEIALPGWCNECIGDIVSAIHNNEVQVIK